MRLLCVIDSLGSGGAQRQMVSLARGLVARQHDVEVFVYHPEDCFRAALDEARIKVHYKRKKSRFSLGPLLALRKLVRAGGFDAVLAFLETPCVYAEWACFGLSDVRLVVGERSSISGRRVGISRWLKSLSHKLADAVVTNSHAHRRWMEEKHRWLRTRVSTVWNGVDLATFHPSPAKRKETGPTRLVAVGRVRAEKDLVSLAVALGQCVAKGFDVELDWIGRVDDKAYHEEVLRAIDGAGVTTRWRWLGERNDVPDMLRRYDALVLPSLFEGLPNAVCEALASGIPVLVSDVSDNRLLAGDGDRGLVFPPKDPEALASAIAEFSRLSAEQRKQMSQRAREFAEENLSLDACTSAYEAILLGHPGKE